MSSDEMFDIFNEHMIQTGTAPRRLVHAQGLWHQTFHCWIMNKSAEGQARLLFQLRHKDKDTFPGLLDTSCAGHLLSGETAEDGIRELQEELGICVPITELTYCGMVPEETIVPGQWIDREFNHVYIYECNKPIIEYEFQRSEISGLFFVNLKEFQQLLTGDIDAILTDGIVVDERDGKLLHTTRKVYVEDFAPNSDEYYNILFDKIESLMNE